MAADPDPLVEELVRARRDRRILVVAATIGIIGSVGLGMAMFLGALGSAVEGAEQSNHEALAFFLAPLIVCMAVGYVVFRWRSRRP